MHFVISHCVLFWLVVYASDTQIKFNWLVDWHYRRD